MFVRVMRPRSMAGRIWNLGQDACALFSLTLIALRIARVITWSWWWVLAPLWISGILVATAVSALLAVLIWNANRPCRPNHLMRKHQHDWPAA
jgi:hypothetical protein